MELDVSGKRTLITGASSGLGAQFARTLARSGARVALAARRTDKLAALADEIGAAGGQVICIPLDVADPQSISQCIAAVQQEWGGLDVVVNNAGITDIKPAIAYEAADFDSILDVNLRGAFLVAQQAALVMRENGGSIINIASILATRQAMHVSAYAISKAGVVQMTKVLALEWARYKIRVNAIAPGYVETAMNEGFWDTQAGKAMMQRIPQRRVGQPQELDAPLLLLACDASSYMTGSVIVVDGGHSIASI
ncbi:glucose 1-dehydrogenase [Croceicoccus sp. F390]|uniref:Glucose 1-dehydrogenase n=1 Tax=Croceicoccus esteveae TaxID=3075597 RepID=A0ABU2ZH05_9SPHN|nr:glucose 1-dehydrogenase [Croceicoccus sp. F390]MDT0575870.1 glucose 1-dehydrogenase [Croceicoccus sp. F390]